MKRIGGSEPTLLRALRGALFYFPKKPNKPEFRVYKVPDELVNFTKIYIKFKFL
jgi:hypothetical protein